MKKFILSQFTVAGVLAAAVMSTGCAKQAEPVALVAVEGDARAPFEVKTTLSGAIEPGVQHALVLEIRPQIGVDAIKTALRGIDGVKLDNERAVSHPATKVGESIRHKGVVEVPAGVAGTLAVDISWRKGTETQSTTLAIDIHAVGATKKTPPIGRIERAADGTQVQVMPAEVR